MPAMPPAADKLAALFPEPVVGYSYTPAMRIAAALIVLLSVSVALSTWWQGMGPTTPGGMLIFMVAAGMVMSGWYIVMGKTTVDATGINQQWVMPKQYRWEEIYRARLMRLPMNTRLMLTTRRPPFKSVHAGTPELREAFEKISELYARAAAQQA